MFPVYSDKLLCGTFSYVQMNYRSAPESWFKKDFSIYGAPMRCRRTPLLTFHSEWSSWLLCKMPSLKQGTAWR